MIVLLYVLLAVNVVAGLEVLGHIIHDKPFRTDADLLCVVLTALLTPANIIWLAQF